MILSTPRNDWAAVLETRQSLSVLVPGMLALLRVLFRGGESRVNEERFTAAVRNVKTAEDVEAIVRGLIAFGTEAITLHDCCRAIPPG